MTENNVNKVIIVGGGLVGALSACFMAKRGYQVSLFEKREDCRKANNVEGRSINLALSHRGRKALRIVGLEDEILKTAIPMRGRLLHAKTGEKTSVPYDPTSSQCIYSIGRNHLNQVLLNATERYGNVTLQFQHKHVSTNFVDGTAIFLDVVKNERVTVQADLIIGADGAFSSVRKQMQITPLFQFSQTYIEHGYLELCVPKEQSHLMEGNHLHIWPRGEFMMIALPNQDRTWTVTLFMPFKIFESIKNPQDVSEFFKNTFPDALEIIGEERLIKDFFRAKPSPLVMIKCSPYHVGDKSLIIGDAAHAMVPFYGQGMNAGFEDCTIFNEVLDQFKDNIPLSIAHFSEIRKPDAHAICDLAIYNYEEMRDLVTKYSYTLRKHFDGMLYKLFPKTWVPLYNSVSFSHMEYSQCIANRKWQDKVIFYGGILLFVFLAWFIMFGI